jgi:hypothetical protein
MKRAVGGFNRNGRDDYILAWEHGGNLRHRVKPEEILYVVREMSRLRDEGEEPDWYSMMFILKDRYEGEKEQVVKLFCISERMRCLVDMTKDARMRGWSMKAIQKDCLLTNEVVFRGVALCPMKRDEDGRRMHFDPDVFFDIVLQECESEGRA